MTETGASSANTWGLAHPFVSSRIELPHPCRAVCDRPEGPLYR